MLTYDQSRKVGEFLEAAWDSESSLERTKWARLALEIDPDELDAYLLLAEGKIAPAESLALLSEAVRRGKLLWSEEMKRPAQSHFWASFKTRPFMRCLHMLALKKWSFGEYGAAIEYAKLLLRLNSNDNQGIRYMLAAWFPVTGDWEALVKLLNKYDDDNGTELSYARCLIAIRLGVDKESKLNAALNANSYVPEYLSNDKKVPQTRSDGLLAGYVELGSEGEAHGYAEFNREAWRSVKGALKWLAQATRSER